jgi:hypothetical protein
MMNRSARCFATALALAGVAFSALWPLASHARPASKGVSMVICVAGGMQVVHIDADGAPQPAGHDKREHCALCLEAIDPVAAVSPAPVVLEISAPRDGITVARHVSYDLLHPYRPPPRAPPSGLPA